MLVLFGVLLEVLGLTQKILVEGHGRFINPPSRASMWRYGFNNPTDYNDNEGYCGGYSVQWNTYKGKCGICGDSFGIASPRPHETGGKYGNQVIVRTYARGSVIPVEVDITANHLGHIEFKICAVPPNVEATEECLNQRPLKLDGKTDSKFNIGTTKGPINLKVQLPSDLTCDRCVIRWEYVTGNNWGTCPNGSGAVGCGPQETFRACADVRINSNGVTVTTKNPGPVTPPPAATTTKQTTTARPGTSTSKPQVTTRTNTVKPGSCRPTATYASTPGMEKWCNDNCKAPVPYCPATHCICS